MIHKCICSQYSWKPPPAAPKQTRAGAVAEPATGSEKPRPCLGRGRGGEYCLPAGRLRWSATRLGVQSKFSHQFSGVCKETLKTSVPLPREGRERTRERRQLCQSTPNQSSVATGLSQAGRGSVTTPSSSRPWRRPQGPGPPPGASLQSPTWSGRSRTSGSRAWAYRQEWSRRR